jgi:uncharacterized membrane protein (DUF373 family)
MPQDDRRRGWDLGRIAEPALALADRWVYLLVAVFLIVAAFLILVYSLVSFIDEVGADFPRAVLLLINDLLLVLIVLEVLGTVRDYLATGTTSLRIFLYVGIISAIRRILAIGAQTTIGEGVDRAALRDLMLDLSVNALVVLALAASLYLVGHQMPLVRGNRTASKEVEEVDRMQRGSDGDDPA